MMMNAKTKLAAVTFSALAIGGIGTGVAHAATPKAPVVSQSASSTAHPGVDSGPNVQQGDQSAPDTTTGAEAASTTGPATVDSGPNVQQGNQSGPDVAGKG